MRRWMWGLLALVVVVVVVVAIASSGGGYVAFQVVAALTFGWLSFLRRVGPGMPAWSGVASLLVCLVPLSIGLHAFLRWFYANLGVAEDPPETGPGRRRRRWRVRWTGAILAVVVLMFVAGISAAGIAHQAAWLIRDRGTLTRVRDFGEGSRSLREVAGCLLNLGYDRDGPPFIPPGATFDADGRPLHGWQTLVLPYLGLRSDHIDREIPWNDPKNATCFKAFVPQYLNFEIPVVRDREGYGLSHYAGNLHVLGRRPTPLADLPNGTANTLLIGGVASNLKPWGMPLTDRDPTLGLNASPDGFTSVSGDDVVFAFADGSVRFVGKNVDPRVLRAMSGLGPR